MKDVMGLAKNVLAEPLKVKTKRNPLSRSNLNQINRYWCAANYLSVGQIYLSDNPLLREPLDLSQIKPHISGHWGTVPGQNFIYVHLNRIIKKFDLNMIYISGPGHGGSAIVGNSYLEGTYTETYPEITQDEKGLKKLFGLGGLTGNISPECPGSIQAGGELGYSLSHAFGAVFDNPDLIAACVIGDGEAETGPLATAWHSNKFLNPISDGVVLPILHLNGYKSYNPSVLARITPKELKQMFRGFGWKPYFVEGSNPKRMHQLMAVALEKVIRKIRKIQNRAGYLNDATRARWPMIVLRTPDGWTGPDLVDNVQIKGTFHAHQIPLIVDRQHPEHLQLLEEWMRSYKPESLFDDNGSLFPELAKMAPAGDRRMGANPHANGGSLLRDLNLPDISKYAVKVSFPGSFQDADANNTGDFFRMVIRLNSDPRHFRIFGPDEILSNQLNSVFDVTHNQWLARTLKTDEFLSSDGHIMEMLSEHQCEGWLEGYLLTGRHGVLSCREDFIQIIDSMFNQHVSWLKISAKFPWRRKIASLNYFLTSDSEELYNNGFNYPDPGFIDHAINNNSAFVSVYLPPDDNCQLHVWDQCLKSKDHVNVIIAANYQMPQWLTHEEAHLHCNEGIGIWKWASNDHGPEPDIVMACCGDIATLETIAAAGILQAHLPDLKIRVINVVDLMKLELASGDGGLSDFGFDSLFTKDKPVIFAFHGYSKVIHQLTCHRTNHKNFHVCGYMEERTITTRFNMTVLNQLDRFHLVQEVLRRVSETDHNAVKLKRAMKELLTRHRRYFEKHGVDLPEILDWKWNELKWNNHG